MLVKEVNNSDGNPRAFQKKCREGLQSLSSRCIDVCFWAVAKETEDAGMSMAED